MCAQVWVAVKELKLSHCDKRKPYCVLYIYISMLSSLAATHLSLIRFSNTHKLATHLMPSLHVRTFDENLLFAQLLNVLAEAGEPHARRACSSRV